MRRRNAILLTLVTVALVLVLLAGSLAVHSDCECQVRVTGRLVDGDGHSPVAGAWVMTLPSRADPEDPVEAGWRRRKIEEHHRGGETEPRHDLRNSGGDYTLADGKFAFDLTVRWSYSRVAGITLWLRHPPARHGIVAIRIEIEGRDPVILDAPHGT